MTITLGRRQFWDRVCKDVRGVTEMRNVIFAINITLDGCCDNTKGIADEEIHEYFTGLMRDVDLLALSYGST